MDYFDLLILILKLICLSTNERNAHSHDVTADFNLNILGSITHAQCIYII